MTRGAVAVALMSVDEALGRVARVDALERPVGQFIQQRAS